MFAKNQIQSLQIVLGIQMLMNKLIMKHTEFGNRVAMISKLDFN